MIARLAPFALAIAAALSAADGARAAEGAARIEIERAFDVMRRERGYAFVFDSRLVAGKSIAFDAQDGAAALRRALEDAGLDLQQISAKTFAVREFPSPDASATPLVGAALDPPPPIDTILVLGSATVGAMTSGSRHIFDLDTDELAYLAVTSPAEAIYDLPQSLASFTPSNTALFGATAGISLADLRGLGPRRTLVLVNGRNRTQTTGGNGSIGGVDLNSIAEPFLDRIEIESLPGGARHGAGATGGVINFVTKSALSGVEGGAHAGITERGDGEELSIYALGGFNIGSIGNLTIGVNATRQEGLIGADRRFSATPYGFGAEGHRTNNPDDEFLPGYGGSYTSERGAVAGVTLANGQFAPFPGRITYYPNADGTLSPINGAIGQLYNYAAMQSIALPSDRLLGMASLTGDLSSDWRYFVEASAAISATDNALAPLPGTRSRGVDPVTGDAAVIPLSNPALPQSVRDLVVGTFGGAATGVVFDHRYVELGPRRDVIDRQYLDAAIGVETGDHGGAALSAVYRFARNKVTLVDRRRIDANRLAIALDPARCAATQGCALIDFFSAPEIPETTIDFLLAPDIRRRIVVEEHEATLSGSTPLRFSDDLEGSASAGVSISRESLKDKNHVPAGVAPIGILGGVDQAASVTTADAHLTVETPLVRSGAPFDLDGMLSLRATRSSAFDTAFNFEAGVDWRPFEGVSLFMRRHIGERTPDLIEQYSIGAPLEAAFQDPCGRSPSLQSAVVRANCTSGGPLGVSPGFAQTAPLAGGAFYGNPDLDPEQVRTAAYGVRLAVDELAPATPGRLELAATWFDFDIDRAIQSFSNVVSACYESIDFASPACGVNAMTGMPIIRRDPASEQIVGIDEVLVNAGGVNWRGLDLEMRYAVDPAFLPFLDSLWVSVLHTYTNLVRQTDSVGGVERLEGLIDHPRHRTLASIGADAGRWSFVLYGNRRGRALTSRTPVDEARVPAALYLDATARFDLNDRAYLQASVKNLTDKAPAITAFNDVGNFAPEYYDPYGRRYSLSMRLSF